MDLALDTIDNKRYEASDFNRNTAAWIAEHRFALECIVCGNQAFFRKRSVSGQAACFGARPHSEDCELATQSSEEGERAEAIERFIRENPGNHFELKLTLPKPPARTIGWAGLGQNSAGGEGGRFTKWGKKQESSSTIQAKQVLINLALSEEYRESTQTVATPKSGGKIPIRDYFIPFQDASASDAGVERGYWGSITNVGVHEDATWLNTGYKRHMSILLSGKVKEALIEAYNLDGIDDLIGSYVLVVGELRVSAGSKKYMTPTAARRFALYFPKDI